MSENYISREEFDRIVNELNKLKSENEYLKSKVIELEFRLARYENPHTPPSMRINRYPKKEPSGNPVGKPEGSNGATRKLGKPDMIIEAKPHRCRNCNGLLGEPEDWITKRTIDLPPPQKPVITDFELGICTCPNCGVENIGADPGCPIKGEFGPRALALVQDLRFRERMSVCMVRTFLRERYNLDISNATILDMTSRTARALRDSHNDLVMRIQRSLAVHVDETGFYVNGIRVWCWVFTTDHDTLVVIRNSRGSRIPRQILGDNYRGVVVSDCYSAYDLLKKQLSKARFQKCWAHVMRESKICSQDSENGKELHNKLKYFHARISGFIANNPTPDMREREYENILKEFDQFLSLEFDEYRPSKLIKRLRKYREDWFTCVLIPGVDPTNNRAERALRPQVILRRLRGSLRSERGKEDHETMTSLMASWELQGLNPVIQLEHELSQVFAEREFM